MTQNIIKLKNEKILLEYLYNKLLHGNIKEITSTQGISTFFLLLFCIAIIIG